MWNVITRASEDIGVVDVNATFTTETEQFSYSSTIKRGELTTFVEKAKEALLEYQQSKEKDDFYKEKLEELLNK